MTYYGGKELAASFRTVRNNTIQIAEDIPEDSYSFKAAEGCRTVGRTLVHIGTGAMFQVPTLIGVGARAPFMHDGCAATLMDRFVTCGGGDAHGTTKALSQTQLTDLVTYLESL